MTIDFNPNPAESTNPYIRTPEEPILIPSVVAYIDILGYHEMASRAHCHNRDSEFLQNLHRAFSKGQNWLQGKLPGPKIGKKHFCALKAFTDNIVLGYPLIRSKSDGEVELGHVFFLLAIFQFEVTVAGFFTRGAISIGDLYIDDNIVFGNGLTEAYEGEIQLARDPRIVLTKSAAEAVKKHLKYYADPHESPQYRDLYLDSDGQLFLNYLDYILIAEEEIGPSFDGLEKHREIIEQKLSEYMGNPVIWSKYFWVAKYHNFFCSQFPNYFDKSHMVDLEKFQLRPSTIV